MTRKFHIRTFGCQMNEHDSERIAGLMAADGLHATDDPNLADVIVLNTCCIRENADDKLYGNLGHLKTAKELNPDLEIVVAGCLAQKDREIILQRAPHVNVVLGTHNVGHVSDLLASARSSGNSVIEILEEGGEQTANLPGLRESAHSAWVTIQVGCDNSCAFCIVPAVRGPEVSRRTGDIVREITELARDGVSEVTLLGQNVNSYGRDLGSGQFRPLFADLLRAVNDVEGIRRIRFTSPHPKDLRPETIEAMADSDAVCEQLHLPIQSGSDRVLALMHRGYTAERYLERLARARSGIPDLAVTTDIIVGFPGETESDFMQTLEVVEEAKYDSAYTFIFSPRPGTQAAEMTADFIPLEVTRDRMNRLTEAIERHALAHHEARVGLIEEILVEGPSKRDASQLSGRTRQGKLVHVPDPDDGSLISGSYVKARIIHGAPHWLRGEVVGDPVHPRPARTRIPVAVS